MAASEQQFDFLPGLSIPSLPGSISKEQLNQAIAQLAPLSNIGGIVVFSSENGTDWPGVDNNPRFKRYAWIDTYPDNPVLRVYDQSGADGYANWVSIGLSNDSVISDYIAVGGVALYDSDGITKKVSLKHDDTADITKANYGLRIDAAGKRVEVVPISTFLGAGGVPLSSLAPGADNTFIRMDGSTPIWELINFANELADLSVSLGKLSGGPNSGYLLRVSSSGGVEAISNNDTVSGFLSALSITLSKLAQSGASTGQIVKWNGSAWVAATPAVGISSDAAVSTTGIESATKVTIGGVQTIPIAHGLGSTPKLWHVVFVAKNSVAGYTTGDELHLMSIREAGTGTPAALVTVDANNFTVTLGGAGRQVLSKTGATLTNFTANDFAPKVYAWV